MTITSWRVITRRFTDTAFDGEGARIAGGRWNSIGRPMVYTAATTSLGLLELLVNSSGTRLLPIYLTIPVTFDERFVDEVNDPQLPKNWRSHPSPRGVKRIGDDWMASQRSCILRVPSVVVPHECNYLLNPMHSDFRLLEIDDPIELETDSRLV